MSLKNPHEFNFMLQIRKILYDYAGVLLIISFSVLHEFSLLIKVLKTALAGCTHGVLHKNIILTVGNFLALVTYLV